MLMFNIYDPDGYLDGPPHEVFTELRRTQPVFFQEMPDEPGYWAVLKHADVIHVAARAGAVLGQRGRRGAREPRARRARVDAHDAARDGPAPPRRLPAATRAELQGPRDGPTRRPHSQHLSRDHGARRGAARRGVRARRHGTVADPGDRRADGTPSRGLGDAPRARRAANPFVGPRRPIDWSTGDVWPTTTPAAGPSTWPCTAFSSRRPAGLRSRGTT